MARTRNAKKTKTSADGALATETTVDTSAADLAAIEAILNAETVILDPEEIENAAADAIAADEVRTDAYADQESSIDVADEDDVAEVSAESATKVKKTRTAGPKLGFKEGVFKLFSENPAILDSEDGELSEEQLSAVLDSVTQVKVQDKVGNLLACAVSGATPSKLTMIGIKALIDAPGVVTSKQMIAAFKAHGYTDGTANAQAGQMMAMFPVLKLATRTERGVLNPNSNSVILDSFR